MKISVIFSDENEQTKVLYDGMCLKEFENSDFVQISSGCFEVPNEEAISVCATLTLNNFGCNLIVEQNNEIILNSFFDVANPSSTYIRLKAGVFVQIIIDASHELADFKNNKVNAILKWDPNKVGVKHIKEFKSLISGMKKIGIQEVKNILLNFDDWPLGSISRKKFDSLKKELHHLYIIKQP